MRALWFEHVGWGSTRCGRRRTWLAIKARGGGGAALAAPMWPTAWRAQPSMTVAEAEAFAKRLAEYVVQHNMRRDDSPQRQMIYEYFWVIRSARPNSGFRARC